MKTIIFITLFSSLAFAQIKYQPSYTKKNGKNVQGHVKTQKNGTKFDNLKRKK